MNRLCYRLIFNKKRGQLMAVAETIRSEGKAAGTGETNGRHRSASWATLRPIGFSLMLAFGLAAICLPEPSQAQVVAYKPAPSSQQATVLASGNGIPVVNIQTPSSAGLSHNLYGQFDVAPNGVILNNSRTNISTQLAGWIQGNPWLATGSAKVILNEVVASAPSLLNGYLEVAGSQAQVIIANPAGVTCSGCGFLNANRITLTTGSPIVSNGNLDGYRVQGGTIRIDGNGMDASRVGYTDLIARAVEVNAGLWAQSLAVTTGNNVVDAANATATPATPGVGNATPSFAIDVAQLGGMYAGKITLVGTETGVGVRNAGYLGASAGNVVVTVDGQLTNSGHVLASADTRIDASAGVGNTGTIYSQGATRIDTRGDLINAGGLIGAAKDVALSASGASSRIAGNAAATFAAGLAADGTLSGNGTMTANATTAVVAQGQTLATGEAQLSAATLDVTAGKIRGANVALTATAGDLTAGQASIAATGTLAMTTAQTLVHDGASSTAPQITIAAHDVSNVGGQLVQTGTGDTLLALAGNFNNTQGHFATNGVNLTLAAQTLTNTDGQITHAGSGTLTLAVDTLTGSRGTLGSNGLLAMSANSVVLDGGTTFAQRLVLQATNLSNRSGLIEQSGSGDAIVNVTNAFDNHGGQVRSQGNAIVAAATLDNTTGRLQTGGDLQLTATTVSNGQGQLAAGGALRAALVGTLDNTQGAIAAQNDINLQSDGLGNAQGVIGSVAGQVAADTGGGSLNNAAGRIEAARTITLAATGLDNAAGLLVGQNVAVDTRLQALNNDAGTLAADLTLDVRSGALSNNNGLLRAGGALAIDTHGQTLSNTLSGANGGIRGQSTVTIAAGDFNNGNGFIGSTGQLGITATGLDNTAGQIQSAQSINGNVAGSIGNVTGLIRSGAAATLTAGQLANGSTQGTNQGIEGQSVTLAVSQIDNSGGAIRADTTLTLSSGGTVNNTNGLISSADTLNVVDPHASPTANSPAKTLAVANAGGVMIADQLLQLDAASLVGNGQLLSRNDLGVKLSTDTVHTGEMTANRNATIEVGGTLTNSGLLQAGNALSVTAGTLDNAASGQILGSSLQLTVTDTALTNRGLINGSDVFITAGTLASLGSGRVYGDHVAIATATLTNAAEGASTPVIAARNRLDIGVATLNNLEGAQLFSIGDLAIGGALDTHRFATAQATTINNQSATIEALGNLTANAATINNTNAHLTTTTATVGTEPVVEYQGSGAATRYAAGTPDVYVYNDESDHLHTPDGNYEQWSRYDYTRTTTQTQVVSTAPGKISAGGDMQLIAGTLNNSDSQITAGGTLSGSIATLNNTATPGEQHIASVGTVTSFWRDHQKGRDSTGSSTTAYQPPDEIQTINLGTTVYQDHTAIGGSATTVGGLSVGSVAQNATGAAAANTGAALATVPRITSVTALGSTSTVPQVVATVTPNTSIPSNSLYHVTTSATTHYLVATDPQFTNYRTWLSSDYLLQQLALDPATTQERLGDGFYEQRLVTEQVAQLTGRRFLAGYADDEAQYRALMNAGVTVAKQWHLIPGVALTDAQMAALTTDIVWLVAKDVKLADGSTQKVLVPQVYAHVQNSDLSASGTLIAANNVDLALSADLSNSGTIAGRQLVSLSAENIKNFGAISGTNVVAAARNDLSVLGGTITAANNLVATAGHDLTVATATRTQTNAQGSLTNADRLAGLYVTGSDGTATGGQLVAQAGHDLSLLAAALSNSAPTAAGTTAGSTKVVAGNDLTVGTLRESTSNLIVWDGNNRRSDASTTDVGSTLRSAGDLALTAGRDLTTTAGSITSDQGALTGIAGRDLKITAGQATASVDENHQHTETGLLSSKTHTTRDALDDNSAVASTLSGDTVTLAAANDLTVHGSNVAATHELALSATNVTIEAARQTHQETHYDKTTQSGIFGSGGIGFTIGSRMLSTNQQSDGSSAAASTLGSVAGNVEINAGKAYRQVGSDIVVPAGNIDVTAQNIAIEEAREANKTTYTTEMRQSGLTIAITSPVISAIQTISQMAQAAGDTKDDRMKALAAASAGMAGYQGYQAIQAGQGKTVEIKNDDGSTSPKDNQIATGKTLADGSPEYRDATASDKVGGVNLSVSLGASSSSSKTIQTSDNAAGSTLSAGGSIALTATGAGKDSDITVQGSSLTAAKNVTLTADDEIKLLAAANTASQQSTNKSSSASIGFSVGTGGFMVNLSASAARGNADGNDVTWTNSHVQAGEVLTLQSGGDTTIKGAVAGGKTVVANIGGNLAIESLQDTSTYQSKQQSAGFSLSIPISAGMASGSISASSSKINSNYASVTEQSGLLAGDGGFNVKVQGDSDLKGAAIASTQLAVADGKNTFQTGGKLTLEDVQNRADYNASGVGINLAVGPDSKGQLTPTGTSAGIGQDAGSAGSTTKAGISGLAGNMGVRTGDASSGIAKIFDADQVQKDIDAQVKITQSFGQQASKLVGDYAAAKLKEADALRSQGREDEAKAIEALWGDTGTLRIAAHTVIGGLTGGTSGAAGALAGTLTAPLVSDELAKAGINGPLATALTALASTAAGAAVGGSAGAATALNEVANNFLMHNQPKEFAKKYADCDKAANPSGCRQQVTKDIAQASLDNQKALDACLQSGNQACRQDFRQGIADAEAGYRQLGAMTGYDLTNIYKADGERASDIITNCGAGTGLAICSLEQTIARGIQNLTFGLLGGVSIPAKGRLAEVSTISDNGANSAGATGTVFDAIKATQPTYPGSVIPKSFEMSLPNGQNVWVAGNVTEHIAEFAQMTAVNYTPEAVRLASQEQLTSLQAAVNTATQNGITYNQVMTVGGWELKFAPPRQVGQLPSLIHALPGQ